MNWKTPGKISILRVFNALLYKRLNLKAIYETKTAYEAFS